MRVDNKELIRELSNILKSRLADNLKDVVLFGSQATGKSHRDSDYDILIVLRDKINWQKEREISDLCYEIELKYGIITDTHILSETEFTSMRGKQPLFVNALDKGFRA